MEYGRDDTILETISLTDDPGSHDYFPQTPALSSSATETLGLFGPARDCASDEAGSVKPFFKPNRKKLHWKNGLFKTSNWLRCGFLMMWWQEILAIVFNFTCLALSIGVLSILDGKRYRVFRMANIDITPNALVSILSILSKSAFLLATTQSIGQLKWIYLKQRPHRLADLQTFDDATRGPLGSMKLVWKLKFRAMIASLGAILVILALATEPFTQQILSYPVSMSNSKNNTASIQATHVLDTRFYQPHGPSKNVKVLFDYRIADALGSALYGLPLQSPYNCSSGTCNWPKFESLGLCSDCRDISEQLQTICRANETYCEYHLPSGDWFWAAWYSQAEVETSASNPPAALFPTTMLNVSVEFVGTEMGLADQVRTNVLGDFARLTNIRFEKFYTNPDGRLQAKQISPQVMQCTLKWCIKTFSKSEVDKGILSDMPTSFSELQVDMTSCRDHSVSSGFNIVCRAQRVPQNRSASTVRNSRSDLNADDIFYLNNLSIMELQYEFTSIFDATWLIPWWTETRNHSAIPHEVWAMLGQYRNSSIVIEPLLEQLYFANGGDISLTWNDVATSVTNQLRGTPNATMVHGTVKTPEALVHVSWSWLAFPALLASLATLLLATTIVFSMESENSIWKSSVLPLLFHSLQEREPKDGEDEDIIGLEGISEKIQIHLCEDEAGRIRFFRHQ